MGWLGVLAVLVAAGALMGLALLCRRAAARLPIDPTIGFRDPQRDNLGVYGASNSASRGEIGEVERVTLRIRGGATRRR